MDALTLILVVLIVLFLVGGLGWPRPADGPANVNGLLYVLAAIVLVVLLVKLLVVI